MKKHIVIFIFVIFSTNLFSQDLRISATGSINFDNSLYTVSEAGEDFPSSVTSNSSIYLSLNYTNFWDGLFGSDIQWQIYVHKSDIAWNNNLDLKIIRDGNGSRASLWGSYPVLTYGENYQSITNNPGFFFRGRYGAENIPLSLKLSGASLTMGAQQFETIVVFTFYDDW